VPISHLALTKPSLERFPRLPVRSLASHSSSLY
jgi:hypothetical protein